MPSSFRVASPAVLGSISSVAHALLSLGSQARVVDHGEPFNHLEESILIMVVNLGHVQDEHLWALGFSHALLLDALAGVKAGIDDVFEHRGRAVALALGLQDELIGQVALDLGAAEDTADFLVVRLLDVSGHDWPVGFSHDLAVEAASIDHLNDSELGEKQVTAFQAGGGAGGREADLDVELVLAS